MPSDELHEWRRRVSPAARFLERRRRKVNKDGPPLYSTKQQQNRTRSSSRTSREAAAELHRTRKALFSQPNRAELKVDRAAAARAKKKNGMGIGSPHSSWLEAPAVRSKALASRFLPSLLPASLAPASWRCASKRMPAAPGVIGLMVTMDDAALLPEWLEAHMP